MTEDIAVTRLRDYLRIKTEQPDPTYEECRDFLIGYANELGIPYVVYETSPNVYLVVMTIEGSDPSLKSIMLYSHTDVVETVAEDWTHHPYSAHKNENGDIFARGAQDMKFLGVTYMEAIRKLFNAGKKQFKRTVHIVWGPDEEVGTKSGMKKFVKWPEFQKMNVAFSTDESMSWPGDSFKVFYGDKMTWWIKVTCTGAPHHGALLGSHTAVEKLTKFLNNVNASRDEKVRALHAAGDLTVHGDLTTFNVTVINGGGGINTISSSFEAIIDMRVTPKDDLDDVKKMIEKWISDVGEDGITYEFLQYNDAKEVTPHTRDDPFWRAFEDSLNFHNCEFTKHICPGHTDSTFVRSTGVRSIGFSPLSNTEIRIHGRDEYINERVFLKGVDIYVTLIENLASVVDENK